MSRYTVLPSGHNNNRYRPTIADPAPDLVLTGPRAAVVHLVDINSYYPAVLVEGEGWFVGSDAFSTSEEALRVAEARVRERANGDGQ